MKKLIGIAAAFFITSSVFAFDFSFMLKGIVGADNASLNGMCLGGGINVNLNFYKGLGLQIESNIITSKLVSVNDELTFENHFTIDIPVMAWYNCKISNFALGGGLGINCSIIDNTKTNEDFNWKIDFAGGLNVKYYFNEKIGIVLGGTGTLDCIPTLLRQKKAEQTSYKFTKTNWKRNSLKGWLGVEYKFF